MSNGYKTAGKQARYLENISTEFVILAAAIQATVQGPDRLEALTEDQQEHLVKIGRAVRGQAAALYDIAEAVGKVGTNTPQH